MENFSFFAVLCALWLGFGLMSAQAQAPTIKSRTFYYNGTCTGTDQVFSKPFSPTVTGTVIGGDILLFQPPAGTGINYAFVGIAGGTNIILWAGPGQSTSISLAPVTQILLKDDFFSDTPGPVSSATWSYPTGPAEFIPSTLGPGAPGTETAPYLPSVSDGALHLTLQTFNPTSSPPGTSFQGSAIFSNQSFNTNAGGIAFTAVAKLATTVPGMVGGIFAYGLNSPTSHNEIDFELLTDIAAAKNDQAQTNIYANAPTNAVGNPSLVPDPSLTVYHTYTMEWFPNEVLWFIDGQLVRQSTVDVPQGSMQFYLNFWAYDAGASLQPTNLQNNKIYAFDVQRVSVARIENNTSTPPHVTSFPGHTGIGTTGAASLGAGFPVTTTTLVAFDLSCNSGSWQAFLTLWLVS